MGGLHSEVKWKCLSLSCVWLSVTPGTAAHQPPLSMEFSRQQYRSGLPFPSLGDLPDPGIELRSPALQGILYCLNHQGSLKEDVHRLYALATLFHTRGLNIRGFWKPQGVLKPVPCRHQGTRVQPEPRTLAGTKPSAHDSCYYCAYLGVYFLRDRPAPNPGMHVGYLLPLP